MKTRRKIIPGERFDRLVVIKKDGVHIKPCGTKQSKYLCICDCGKYDHNGIDRVDSKRGYTIDNVVSCCKICNIAKSNMDQKDFIEWLQRAANHTKAMAEQWSKYLCELPEND